MSSTRIRFGDAKQETKIRHLPQITFKIYRQNRYSERIVLCESELAKKWGLNAGPHSKEALRKLFPADTVRAFQRSVKEVFQGKKKAFEWYFKGKQLCTILSPVKEDDAVKEIIGFTIHLSDMPRDNASPQDPACSGFQTRLPNQFAFQEHLTECIANDHHRQHAVLLIDFDRFKNVSQILGRVVGNQLLQQAADRLTQKYAEKPNVELFHFGRDEFVLLAKRIADENEAARIAEALRALFKKPFHVDGYELRLTVSIGISLYPCHGKQAEDLVKGADTALDQAKQQGGNTFQFYRFGVGAVAQANFNLENDLHRALEKEELLVYYQPQIALSKPRLCGVEALLRWQHPQKGLLMPSSFIPLAEQTGLIIPIGEYVLRRACLDYHRFWQFGIPPIPIAVNLSVRQFFKKDLVDRFSEIIQDTGCDPAFIHLEITESMAIDIEHTATMLKTFKTLGFQISLDDFGTGYSSLNYVRHLPLDHLKIDRSFVSELHNDRKVQALVRSIISLGHSLGLTIIAEGIETKEQLQFLRKAGADRAQGHLFSPAMPSDALIRWRLNRD